MPSFVADPDGRVLYLIVCAAPPARTICDVVRAKQEDGWQVVVTATPNASGWIDVPLLEATSGHRVRTESDPDGNDVLPLGNAVLVSPATFNTINKWAAGISDTLALGLLNEALGRGVPIEAEVHVNDALSSHPAYQQSLRLLGDLGVVLRINS